MQTPPVSNCRRAVCVYTVIVMYLLLTLFAGLLISSLAVINGTLTARVGLYLTTVIIHIVAICFALLLLAARKESFIPKEKLPAWMYSGGFISVLCTLCSNYAFGKISLIAITALGLLAQAMTSLVIDSLGALGARKRPIKSYSLVCMGFSLCGIVYMLYGSEMTVFSAIAASFMAGVGLVVSRMISAAVARSSGAIGSSLINHVVGLPLAVALLFILGGSELSALPASLGTAPLWAYTGGIAGLFIIVITNIVLDKVSAFRVSMLLFVGQVFSGAAIDFLMGVDFSGRTFFGGVIIAVGVAANTLLEKRFAKAAD